MSWFYVLFFFLVLFLFLGIEKKNETKRRAGRLAPGGSKPGGWWSEQWCGGSRALLSKCIAWKLRVDVKRRI